MGERESPQ